MQQNDYNNRYYHFT